MHEEKRAEEYEDPEHDPKQLDPQVGRGNCRGLDGSCRLGGCGADLE